MIETAIIDSSAEQIPRYVSVERLIAERTRCSDEADKALSDGNEANRLRWHRAWLVLDRLICEAGEERKEKPK